VVATALPLRISGGAGPPSVVVASSSTVVASSLVSEPDGSRSGFCFFFKIEKLIFYISLFN
jgi:hypothetical protein